VDPVVIGRAERLDAIEVFDGQRDGGATRRSRAQRPVNSEKVTVAVDQHNRLAEKGGLLRKMHAEIGESARILRRAREGRELGKDVRLLQDHDRAAVAGLCMIESLPKPGKIRLVALGVFGIAGGGAPEPVVAAGDVQRQERHATLLPANVFLVLGERGTTLALSGQREGTLAEAAIAIEEDRPQLGEPLQRIASLDFGLVTVRPFIVAGCVDDGMGQRAELRQAARPQLVRAAKARRRQIADMNDECERGIAVQIGEDILQLRFLLRRIGKVTDERECEPGWRSLAPCWIGRRDQDSDDNGDDGGAGDDEGDALQACSLQGLHEGVSRAEWSPVPASPS
jgi:hypothetical protein